MGKNSLVFGPALIQFNSQRGVLVDNMCIPLTHAEVLLLLSEVQSHLSKSPREVQSIAREIVAQHFPGMLQQLDFDRYVKE